MYQEHFGLREPPFTLTPNTRFFLNLPGYQEALNLLLVALLGGDGFVKIIGEVGTGKTLLCRKLLNELDARGYVTAYIANPSLSPAELQHSFALELGLAVNDSTTLALRQLIDQHLIERARAQKKVVLVVDEAQAMPEATVEALRLLTNLETESSKLFQVVLFGQPELDRMLARVSLRQLKQRITFSYQLPPLSDAEVADYLHWRLKQAGSTAERLFLPAATRQLAQAAGGIPRRINVLAHKALLAAYGKGAQQVSAAHVASAIADERSAASGQGAIAALGGWDLLVVMLAMVLSALAVWGLNA